MAERIVIPSPQQIRERIVARREEIRHLKQMLKLATSAVRADQARANGDAQQQTQEVAHAK